MLDGFPPNAFAFVMATGIAASAFTTAGFRPIGVALFVIAAVALIVLAALLIARTAVASAAVDADLRAPGRAFGFFTITAALGVLAASASLLSLHWVAVVAAVIGVPVWLALTYAMLPLLVVRAGEPIARAVDGSWMLWVVATQAVAIIMAVLGAGTVGITVWGAGVLLYLLIAGLLIGRVLGARDGEPVSAPTAWVVMGAAAISALAAARLLNMPELYGLSPFLLGMGLLLWGFASWCVPYLLVAAVWKRAVKRRPFRYETALWAVVFPLGMYTAATQALAAASASPLLHNVGQVGLWVTGIAWVAVAVLGVVAAIGWMMGRELVK